MKWHQRQQLCLSGVSLRRERFSRTGYTFAVVGLLQVVINFSAHKLPRPTPTAAHGEQRRTPQPTSTHRILPKNGNEQDHVWARTSPQGHLRATHLYSSRPPDSAKNNNRLESFCRDRVR
ncbi:uncharacterized protein LOC111261460 isoform X3 [Varroa jacobsoni]|uniref:uncharacterized protein LOC111261460 isoform X3 n=1 Tax=Varroa jacobsoni TaxID=62625 RepID=UPI000BF7A71C|nr:uncharacterized protein LOC111261460 isoform X3 [Varroa jacobsoni]